MGIKCVQKLAAVTEENRQYVVMKKLKLHGSGYVKYLKITD